VRYRTDDAHTSTLSCFQWSRIVPCSFGLKRPVAQARQRSTKEQIMSLGTILLIVLILILIGVLPTWPHARNWGYGPSGIVGVLLIILIVLFLMGRL
jgi:hypothetical protein